MGNIVINNSEVLHTILKEVKKTQTGLGRLFLSKVSEDEAKKVKELIFRNINISDFDFLRYFPNLETLTLVNVVGIKDTSGFAYCCNLKILDINDTYIEDFEALKYCTELEYFYYLCEADNSNCKRDDFSFLQNFSKLLEIDIAGNNVHDISFLSDHPTLEQLVLFENPIRSIAPLKTIKNLKWLEIDSCGLTELEDIEQFPAITALFATHNHFDIDQRIRYKEILNSLEKVEF